MRLAMGLIFCSGDLMHCADGAGLLLKKKGLPSESASNLLHKMKREQHLKINSKPLAPAAGAAAPATPTGSSFSQVKSGQQAGRATPDEDEKKKFKPISGQFEFAEFVAEEDKEDVAHANAAKNATNCLKDDDSTCESVKIANPWWQAQLPDKASPVKVRRITVWVDGSNEQSRAMFGLAEDEGTAVLPGNYGDYVDGDMTEGHTHCGIRAGVFNSDGVREAHWHEADVAKHPCRPDFPGLPCGYPLADFPIKGSLRRCKPAPSRDGPGDDKLEDEDEDESDEKAKEDSTSCENCFTQLKESKVIPTGGDGPDPLALVHGTENEKGNTQPHAAPGDDSSPAPRPEGDHVAPGDEVESDGSTYEGPRDDPIKPRIARWNKVGNEYKIEFHCPPDTKGDFVFVQLESDLCGGKGSDVTTPSLVNPDNQMRHVFGIERKIKMRYVNIEGPK
eukprot:g4960.t1